MAASFDIHIVDKIVPDNSKETVTFAGRFNRKEGRQHRITSHLQRILLELMIEINMLRRKILNFCQTKMEQNVYDIYVWIFLVGIGFSW